MNFFSIKSIWFVCAGFFFLAASVLADAPSATHVWEMHEITLQSDHEYSNAYADVTCWVELSGPGVSMRVYGFWDGNRTFRVRVTAPAPGVWRWMSASNHPEDHGLNNKSGSFTALAWKELEKESNPNRHGFIRATQNGHALQYADGTPFFMVGDTWLSGTTWRLPFRHAATSVNYQPGPGMGFEDAVQYRKHQGFNSVSMISCFPNWESDTHPSTYADSNNIYLRNAWEKFGYDVRDAHGIDASGGSSYWGSFTSKNMRDETGNLPFEMSAAHAGVSDFNRINPEYFKSLDAKMTYLSEQGFVPLLETVRRDVGPSWKAYFDFNTSYARFVRYLIARYGAYNIVFSGIHLDWIPKDFSLTAAEFNQALTYERSTYGPMPFGQPVTSLISSSTYSVFGHAAQCPWLTMHSVGNKPRDHRVADSLEVLFALTPPYPAINFEPYYTGWNHEINKPNNERPSANSSRDNYFARAQMYGSVLSGGLSGHVHGTSSYDMTTTGEPSGARPHVWDAFKYESAAYMQYLAGFILSEGSAYQLLVPARGDLSPSKANGAPETGLDGWAYMMRTGKKDLALLYFEQGSVVPVAQQFQAGKEYTFQWYDPMTGRWSKKMTMTSDGNGRLSLPKFPGGEDVASKDWAAKIVAKKGRTKSTQ